MKRFLIHLLPSYQMLCYINLHDVNSNSCQSQLKIHPSKPDSSLGGNRVKPKLSSFLLLLKLMLKRSLTVLTGIPRSQPKFSLLLSHYWQSSFNISPALLQVVEGRPLIHLKAIGVIWMISNISMPVKRSGELLHIFGGV